MSQAINLDQTNAVFYDENSVEKLLLNGTQIWEAPMTILSVTKATTKASKLTACVALSITTGSSPVTVTYDGISKTAVAGGTTSIVFADTDDHTYPDSGMVYIVGDVIAIAGYSKSVGDNKTEEYAYCPCVTGVIEWGETWRTIGAYLFYNGEIEELHLPSTITTVSSTALCYSTLARLYIPNMDYWYSVCDQSLFAYGSYGTQLYVNGVLLTSLKTPSTWTEVPSRAFAGIGSLIDVTITANIQSIGSSAFAYCTSLKTVTFEENSQCTYLDSFSFGYCSVLTTITLPESVTELSFRVFTNCTALTNFTFPETTTSLGNLIFESCTALTTLVISNNLTTIPYGLCYGCTSLTTVYTTGRDPETVSIGYYNNKATFTAMPNLTSVGELAFYNCTSLLTADFQNCSLLTTLNSKCFYGCTSLNWFCAYNSPLTKIGSYSFYGDYNITLVGWDNLDAWYYCDSAGTAQALLGLESLTTSDLVRYMAYPSGGATFDDTVGELTGYADVNWVIPE